MGRRCSCLRMLQWQESNRDEPKERLEEEKMKLSFPPVNREGTASCIS
jgi:hypothetical protein